ncbi:hypothetical protein MPTK1_1g28830 [Marchantia polymorpha subsp. ruderalis]
MSELYIPPKELSFRLRGYVSNYVIFARNEPDPTVYHYGGETSADQWFQLIPGTGNHAGSYLIKSKCTGKVLYSRNSPDPRLSQIGGDGQYEDNWFRFDVGTGKLASYFRIRNVGTNTVLYSRTHDDPMFFNYPADYEASDDQYFTFVFEDTEIDRVEYQIDQATVLASVPEVIGTSSLRNDSDVDQTVEFDFERTETQSSSFDYTLGFTITVGASGKAGIPFVAEGEVKVDVSNSHTFNWGTTSSESKTYSVKFPAVAPPRHKIIGTATVTRSNIEIPFTVYSKSVATGFEVATQGIYKGVTYWNIQSEVKQESL